MVRALCRVTWVSAPVRLADNTSPEDPAERHDGPTHDSSAADDLARVHVDAGHHDAAVDDLAAANA